MRNNIISYLNKFNIIFTFTIITYSIFDLLTVEAESFQKIVLECVGLSTILVVVISILDYLGNKIKLLRTNNFIWIQYILLTPIMIFWGYIFKWGDWSNKMYMLMFIGVYTLIYLCIYFFIEVSNKREDMIINDKLKNYQKNKLT